MRKVEQSKVELHEMLCRDKVWRDGDNVKSNTFKEIYYLDRLNDEKSNALFLCVMSGDLNYVYSGNLRD